MRDLIEVDDVDSVRKALKAGVDPNGLDETELPWVVVAIRSDALGCLKLLLESGARADGPKGETLSPLVVALKMGKLRCAELLLQHGADPNRLQSQKRTVLHVAASLKSAPIQAIIAAGALLDAQDERGWTPLMVAASDNRAESAKALVQAGCKTDLKESSGKTAYELAEAAGHREICLLLKASSSSTNGLCPVCQTALVPPARFCPSCGYRIETATKAPKPPVVVADAAPPQPKPAAQEAAKPSTGISPQRSGLFVVFILFAGYQVYSFCSSLSAIFPVLAKPSSSSSTTTAATTGTPASPLASQEVPTWAGTWTGPKDRNGDTMEVVIDSNQLPCGGKVRGLYSGDAEFTATVTWSLKPGTNNVVEGKQTTDRETNIVAVARFEDSRLWGQARLVKPIPSPEGKVNAETITLDIDGYRRR